LETECPLYADVIMTSVCDYVLRHGVAKIPEVASIFATFAMLLLHFVLLKTSHIYT